jgi:hypothetical protein
MEPDGLGIASAGASLLGDGPDGCDADCCNVIETTAADARAGVALVSRATPTKASATTAETGNAANATRNGCSVAARPSRAKTEGRPLV